MEATILGAGGIEYYIPLSGNGTYGVSNYGLSPDFGNGGGTEKMFLYFSPVSGNSVLTIKFQDLDLVGANDPSGFFETLRIFDQGGNPLTPTITSLGSFLNGNVSGDHNAQLLTLALGVVNGPLFLELDFRAHSDSERNEYGRVFTRNCISSAPPGRFGSFRLWVSRVGPCCPQA